MPKPEFLRPGLMVPILVQGQTVMAKYLEWSDKKDIMVVDYNGSRLWRSPRSTLGPNGQSLVGAISDIKSAAAGASPASQSILDMQPEEPAPSRFDINMRFSFVEDLVDMITLGDGKSLIITGEGGLGKSYTVLDRFRLAGLEEIKEDEETGEVQAGDFLMVKGYTTAKTMYRTLYDNRHEHSIIVFDDCDSALKDKTGVNILKAALDSYSERVISWLSELTKNDDELPSRFEFKGKIIFISNLRLDELPQPIISRASYVDVSMGSKEKLERMRTIAFSKRKEAPSAEMIAQHKEAYRGQIKTELTNGEKEQVLKLIEKHADKIGDLNMRTYLKVNEIMRHCRKNWSDIAEYVITAF